MTAYELIFFTYTKLRCSLRLVGCILNLLIVCIVNMFFFIRRFVGDGQTFNMIMISIKYAYVYVYTNLFKQTN